MNTTTEKQAQALIKDIKALEEENKIIVRAMAMIKKLCEENTKLKEELADFKKWNNCESSAEEDEEEDEDED